MSDEGTSSAPLPTPHAPGWMPETPDEAAPTGYSEGPLDQAGRQLSANDTKTALGGALLGAGVGLVLGGPVGAVVGGGLGGLGSLENEGLKSKLRGPGQAGIDAQADREQAHLAESPAQKEVHQAAGPNAAQDLSALLAGGAGATVAEREVDEPAALESTTTASGEHDDFPSPRPPKTIGESANQSADQERRLPNLEQEEQPLKTEDGLSANEKMALGAGAGLAAGGLGAAALNSHHQDDASSRPLMNTEFSGFKSPYSAGAAPGAPTSVNPAVAEPTSQLNPLPQEPMQPQPAMTPEPASGESSSAVPLAAGAGAGTAAYAGSRLGDSQHGDLRSSQGLSDDDKAPLTDADTQVDIRKDPNQQDLPREEEEGLSGKEKAALGAGAGLAVGGLGAAALHLRSDEDEAHLTSSSDANARTFNQSSGLPSEPVQPQPASFAKHDAAGPGAGAGTFAGQHATTEQPAHSQPEVAARKGRIDPQPLDAQRTDESTEQHDEHRKKAEAAAGAALGTAGAAGAVEGLEAVGGSKDDAQFPKDVDPAAALAAQLAGKDQVTPLTNQHAPQTDVAKTDLDSRPTMLDDSGADDPVVQALATKSFEAQRAFPPEPHMRPDGTVADEPEVHKIDPRQLHDTTVVGAVPGFNQSATGPHSTAFDDFAHLSTPPSASSTTAAAGLPTNAAGTSSEGTGLAAAQAEEDRKHGLDKGALAAGALGGGALVGGLAAASAGHHHDEPSNESGLAGNRQLPTGAVATPLVQQHQPAELDATRAPREDQQHSGVPPAAAAAAVPAGAAAGFGAHHLADRDPAAPSTPGQHQSGQASVPSSTRAVHGTPPPTAAASDAHARHGNRAGERDQALGESGHSSLDRHDRLDGSESPDSRRSHEGLAGGATGAGLLAGLNPVEKSPHMKIQTRKDPEGQRRLHKKSLGDPLAHARERAGSESSGGGSGTGAGHGRSVGEGAALGVGTGAGAAALAGHHKHHEHEPVSDAHRDTDFAAAHDQRHHQPATSEGQTMWNSSVSHVVDDETAHRGGHRPGLVGGEQHDEPRRHDDYHRDDDHRRNDIMDRVVGVPDPSHPHGHSHSSKVVADEHGHKKLHRHRRGSSAAGGSIGSEDDAAQHKSGGFFSKVFRRGSKSSGGHAAPAHGHESSPLAAGHGRSSSFEPGEARTSSDVPPVPGVTVPDLDERETRA